MRPNRVWFTKMVKYKIAPDPGVLVDLSFADESVRMLCNSQELLVRAFGSAWRAVARCLRILESVDTVADLAAFVAVVVFQVVRAIDGIVEFVVEHARVHIQMRALTPVPGPVDRQTDREGLALIRAVSIVSVSLAPAVIGA